MAEQADGKIVINTGLDQTGFKKGSQDMQRAIQSLSKQIDAIGHKTESAIQSSLRGFGSPSQVLAFNSTLQETGQAIDGANAKLEESKADLEALRLKAEELSKLKIQTDEYSRITREVQAAKDQLAKLEQQQQKMESSGAGAQAAEWQHVQAQINDARNAVREFEEEKARIDEGRVEISPQEFIEFESQMKDAQAYLAKVQDTAAAMKKQGAEKAAKDWDATKAKVAETRAEIERLEQQQQALKDAGRDVIGGDQTELYKQTTAEIKRTEEALKAAESRLGEQTATLTRNKDLINAEAIEQQKLNILTALERVGAASTAQERAEALRQLEAERLKLQQIAQQSVTPQTTGTQETVSALQRIANAMKNIGVKAFHASVRGLWNGLKGLATHAKSAAKGLLSLGNRMKDTISRGKKTQNVVQGLVKGLTRIRTMLISRIKRTFISYLFQTLTKAVQALAKFDSEFDRSFSNLRNRTAELGANVTVTFGTIIKKAEPILSRIIDAASKAAAGLNALIASLSGAETVTVAKTQTQSYADSLSDSAKAAEDARKEQEKLNATLTSYDQIHKLDGVTDTNPTASDSAEEVNDLFETVPVDKVLGQLPAFAQTMIDRIRAAVRNGNWYGVGSAIAGGLNDALKLVDDSILALRAKAEAWATGVAQALNGLVLGFDGQLLGQTLADGINLAFAALDAFLRTFNFGALGTTISNAIEGLFFGIDWELLGQTVGDGINGIFSLLYNILAQTDWLGMAQEVAAGANKLFETINWTQVGATFAAGFNAVLRSIYGFITEFDWGEAAGDLAEAISAFLQGVEWDKLIGIFVGGINAIISAGAGFVEHFSWGDTGTKLMDAIGQGLQKIDTAKLGKFLSDMLRGVITAGKNLLMNTNWADIAHNLFDKILDLLENIDWGGLQTVLGEFTVGLFKAAFEILVGAITGIGEHAQQWGQDLYDALHENGEFSIQGFFEGLNAAIRAINPLTFIYDKLIKPLIDTVKDKLKIGSPSKVFEELGGYTIEGFRNGIEDNWKTVTDFFPKSITELTGKIKSDWESLRQTIAGVDFSRVGRNAMTTLRSGITGAWGTVRTAATSLWSGLTGDLGKTDFSSVGTKMTASLRSGIRSAWGGLQTAAVGLWGGLRDAFTGTDFTRVGAGFVSGIKNGISSGWSTVSKTALKLWGDLRNDIQKTDFSGAAGNLISGLANGLNDGWVNITNTLWNKCHDMLNVVNSFFKIGSPSRVFYDVGGFLMQGLDNGIAAESRSVMRTVSGLAEGISDSMTPDTTAARESVKRFLSGVTAGTATLEISGDIMAPDTTQAQEAVKRFLSGVTSEAAALEISDDTMTDGLDAAAEKLAGIADAFRAAAQEAAQTMSAITKDALRAAAALAESVRYRKPEITAEADRTRTAAAPQATDALTGMNALSGRLARLAQAIERITGMLPDFERIGVPQVAAGTVIPVKTRIADTTPRREKTIPDNRETNALLAKIIALLEGQTDGGSRTETINLVCEGRKLAEVVRRYSTQTGRITNGGGTR